MGHILLKNGGDAVNRQEAWQRCFAVLVHLSPQFANFLSDFIIIHIAKTIAMNSIIANIEKDPFLLQKLFIISYHFNLNYIVSIV